VDSITVDETLADLNLPADHGALVQAVTPGSPAAEAGIRGGTIVAQLDGEQVRLGGDIITAVDGKSIRTSEALARAITGMGDGDKVKIELLRDGRKRTVEATLAQRPASQAQSTG
jgi:S1-C subfamily serine protease